MSVTLEFNPTEERALLRLAERSGQNLEGIVGDVLCHQVPGFSTDQLSEEERLLLKLSAGLPETIWNRYEELRLKLEEGLMSETEREEFIELNRQVEVWNVERLTLVGQIAQLRGVAFDDALLQLGQVRNQL